MQHMASTFQQQLSDIQSIMSARVTELQTERDSAVAEIKTLRQRVECTSNRLSNMTDIVTSLKSAGYVIEEGEQLFVKKGGLVISIGLTATSSADASIIISSKAPVSRLEFVTDSNGRERFPIAHLPERPSSDALMFIVGYLFDFLDNIDRFSNADGVTDEEKVKINAHFDGLAEYMKESDHIVALNTNLVQLRSNAMIWYRHSKKTVGNIPWSDAEMLLPFEAAFEHAINRKWNNCTSAKVDLIERGIGKEAAQLAIEKETTSVDGNEDKRQRTS